MQGCGCCTQEINAVCFAGKGRADAKAWAKASGALSVVQPGEGRDENAKADEQSEDYSDLEKARPDLGKKDKAAEAAETISVQGRAVSTRPQ